MVFSGIFSLPHSVCSFTIYIWLRGAEQLFCDERWVWGVLLLISFSCFKGVMGGCLATELCNSVSPSVQFSGCWESISGNQHFIHALLDFLERICCWSLSERVVAGWTLSPHTIILTFFLFRQRE